MTTLRLRVNGRAIALDTDPQRPLLSLLRHDLDLTGAKLGCGIGLCGACTVLVDGEPVRACLTPAGDAAGKDVLTVEGLARDGRLSPLQQAFVDHGAVQCGFCTPGLLLAAHALLAADPKPTREAIVERLDGHLCRCGAHQRIVQAVEAAAERTP